MGPARIYPTQAGRTVRTAAIIQRKSGEDGILSSTDARRARRLGCEPSPFVDIEFYRTFASHL